MGSLSYLLALVASVAAADEVASLQPPIPLTPLDASWPADIVASRDAEPVSIDLLLTIDEKGNVTDAQLMAGDERFGLVGQKMAYALRLLPATDGGVPIAVQLPLHLVYTPPPQNLTGVLLAATGEPLPGITVHAGDRTDVTAADGTFAFRGIPAGSVLVHADAGERGIPDETVQVTAGEAVTVRLAEPLPLTEAPVIGTYKRERVEVVSRAISAEQLRTTPGTMGDPLRAISNLPGTVRTPLDAGWLLVRGGSPRDTGVYIDGMAVPMIYHLGGFTSVVHPGFVDTVEFYPGGQSARYGRATAGVVDLVTSRAPKELDLRAGANIIHAGLYAGIPFKNGGLEVGVRRSYLDWVLSALPGVSDEQAGIAPRFYDWEGKLAYKKVDVSILGYSDQMDASNTNGQQVAVTTGTQRFALTGRVDIGERRLRVQPYYGTETLELFAEGIDLDQRSSTRSGGLRIETLDDGIGPWGWSAGFDGEVQDTTIDVNNVQRTGTLWSPEPYADLRIGHDQRVVIGARLDSLLVDSQIPRVGFSPRIGGVLPVTDTLTLTADAGYYHQPPPADLVIGPPEGASLEMEYSYGGGVGATWKPGAVQVDANAYTRRLENETATELDGTLGQGQGLAYGIETITRYNQGRFAGWVTASWARSLRREEPSLPWVGSTYDQPVSVVVVGSFDIGKGWTLASRVRYASGFLLPPDDDTPTAYDIFTGQNVSLLGDSSGRMPAFHSLDFKIAKHLVARHVTLDFYLDVQNLYNRRIPEPLITGFPELVSERYYGYGLPILPILGIDGGFRSAKKSEKRSATPATP